MAFLGRRIAVWTAEIEGVLPDPGCCVSAAGESQLLDAIRQRAPGEPALTAFARFVLAPRGFLAAADEATATALMRITLLIGDSQPLLAREQQIVAAYTDSLARLLAEET